MGTQRVRGGGGVRAYERVCMCVCFRVHIYVHA